MRRWRGRVTLRAKVLTGTSHDSNNVRDKMVARGAATDIPTPARWLFSMVQGQDGKYEEQAKKYDSSTVWEGQYVLFFPRRAMICCTKRDRLVGNESRN